MKLAGVELGRLGHHIIFIRHHHTNGHRRLWSLLSSKGKGGLPLSAVQCRGGGHILGHAEGHVADVAEANPIILSLSSMVADRYWLIIAGSKSGKYWV